MIKHGLAILIATTFPAMAAENVASRHQVRFEGETFDCGTIERAGKVSRFIHSIPPAKYVPEFEPAAGDPLHNSWMITYRIICEGGYRQPAETARGGHKRIVR
ncbi:MAG: hypothetical protein WAN43_12035 [Rhodomicrobium sp.]|jgi:hypothetical protein